MATAQIVSCIVCDGAVRPKQQGVLCVFDGVIEFVTVWPKQQGVLCEGCV